MDIQDYIVSQESLSYIMNSFSSNMIDEYFSSMNDVVKDIYKNIKSSEKNIIYQSDSKIVESSNDKKDKSPIINKYMMIDKNKNIRLVISDDLIFEYFDNPEIFKDIFDILYKLSSKHRYLNIYPAITYLDPIFSFNNMTFFIDILKQIKESKIFDNITSYISKTINTISDIYVSECLSNDIVIRSNYAFLIVHIQSISTSFMGDIIYNKLLKHYIKKCVRNEILPDDILESIDKDNISIYRKLEPKKITL